MLVASQPAGAVSPRIAIAASASSSTAAPKPTTNVRMPRSRSRATAHLGSSRCAGSYGEHHWKPSVTTTTASGTYPAIHAGSATAARVSPSGVQLPECGGGAVKAMPIAPRCPTAGGTSSLPGPHASGYGNVIKPKPMV